MTKTIIAGFAAVLVVAVSSLLPAQDKPPASARLSKAQAETLFHSRVRPLLIRKCNHCHSDGEESKGGLDMTTLAGLLKGGLRHGPSLKPGDAGKSPLYRAVLRSTKLKMPPKEREKLTLEEMADLRKWIDAGAPWSRSATASRWAAKPEDVWAFQPIRKYDVPQVNGIAHPIDAFVRAKQQQKNLSSAPAADKLTLIRRASYDLTGLPPSVAHVEAYLKDQAPNAFDKVIDRLLAGPRYGERWAQHWLDVVRYADTSGFSNDYERPNAWRYRDYVIRSFNEDKPYNRFVMEQLAGDELEPRNPEMLIAVGFLRMGPWEHTGMSVAAVTRQQYLDDITHNTAATFLGLTLRCARCHDHKFDPIPTRDYYRMQAIFAPVQFAERKVAFLDDESIAGFAQRRARAQARVKASSIRIVNERSFVDSKGRDINKRSLVKINNKRKAYLQREVMRFDPLAFTIYNGPPGNYASNRPLNHMPGNRRGKVQEVFVLKGGGLDTPAEKVAPGVLSAVPELAVPPAMNGRRLALAKWLTDPKHPLTARVIVNRVWQHHFGNKGIVATANNLGKMGKRPTHAELLDWLAVWFVENGWSLKKLHRLIMTSATYQQSGNHPEMAKVQQVDGSNDLLAYYPPRRLSAEEIRDSMLAVTGELSTAMGGPGIFPEINMEVALQPRHIMGSVAPAYQPSPTPQERNRRTIYAFRYRTLADPMLEVFNQPNSDTSCECRDQTTVTPQVFALFNGQFVHDRALALAKRLEKAPSNVERLNQAFRLVFGRLPSDTERQRCLKHVRMMLKYHQTHKPAVVEYPKVVRRKMVEELTGELVTWEEDLDGFKNYQRDLKPWDVGPEVRAWGELCLVLLNANEFLYVH